MRRIAFDLDETLGVPVIDGNSIVGFQCRPGCLDLLERLRPSFTLCLWSVSNRRYLDKVLSFGLGKQFLEVYSWDDLPGSWKDVRQIRADFLVDDSPHHRDAADKYGLRDRYIIVPAYGSPADAADPLAWVRQVEQAVGLLGVVGDRAVTEVELPRKPRKCSSWGRNCLVIPRNKAKTPDPSRLRPTRNNSRDP